MSSILKVNTIQDQDGNNIINESSNTITIGASGDTVTTVANLSVDGGTIKLDGNYPTGTRNLAYGNTALDDGSLSGSDNVAIGHAALTANTSGASNTAVGSKTLEANTTSGSNTAVLEPIDASVLETVVV